MKVVTLAAALAAVLVLPTRASAQELPKWDAGVSFGILWGDGWYPETEGYSEPRVAYHFELGRFLTTHLKTDAAVILTNKGEVYDYVPTPVPGVPGVYSFTEHDRTLTIFSGALTYQFFENAMMHPFVSAGVQIGATNDHLHRSAQTYTVNRVPVTVPGIDTSTTSTAARPFVAVGAKSYFNERTFLKSEFSTGVNGNGFSHAVLRLGFGFDF